MVLLNFVDCSKFSLETRHQIRRLIFLLLRCFRIVLRCLSSFTVYCWIWLSAVSPLMKYIIKTDVRVELFFFSGVSGLFWGVDLAWWLHVCASFETRHQKRRHSLLLLLVVMQTPSLMVLINLAVCSRSSLESQSVSASEVRSWGQCCALVQRQNCSYDQKRSDSQNYISVLGPEAMRLAELYIGSRST